MIQQSYNWRKVFEAMDSTKERLEEEFNRVKEQNQLEVRICCICGNKYDYPNDCGSDLRCCSAKCGEDLLNEMAEHFN